MRPWDETLFDEMCALLPPKEAAAHSLLVSGSLPCCPDANGGVEELAEARGGLDRLQRCWS